MKTNAPSPSLSILWLAARALLVAPFVLSAVRHALHWDAALDEMGHLGMPRSALLMAGSIGLRFLGGVSVLTGFRIRWGAALLLAFVVPATFLGHAFWSVPAEQQTHEGIEFLNNLSMTGGVALVLLAGPALMGSRRAADAAAPGSAPTVA